jgi:prevent-host-death family protein
MKRLKLAEARRDFPSLIDEVVEKNEKIVITRHGKPVARLIPFGKPPQNDRHPLRGVSLEISADFDRPMPEMWEALKK